MQLIQAIFEVALFGGGGRPIAIFLALCMTVTPILITAMALRRTL